MNKIGAVFSFTLVIIGIFFSLVMGIISKTFPILGRMSSKFAIGNIYSPLEYVVDFTTMYVASFGLIIIGLIMVIYFFRREYEKNT